LRDEHDNVGFVEILAEFAALAAAEGLPASAVRLAGATARLTQQTGIPVQHSERVRYERWLATARQELGEELAAEALAEGSQMRLEQAIAYALAPYEPAAATDRAPAAQQRRMAPDNLTPRQLEVAVLVARGLTNRQIAERLVVTEAGAAKHVEHILNKLGVGTRAQIAAWAAERGLVTTRSD
jgi:DNA-binding CsgD family transcriptional regulator